jgi:membrane fusion protein
MSTRPLFRAAASNSSQANRLGKIILIRPLSFTFLSGAAVAVALLIVCFFAIGDYTKRSTVTGQLAPDIGILRIYTPQPGIVLRKLAREGQSVKKGETLYVISSERQNRSSEGIQTVISQQVSLRQQSLRDEIAHTRRLQQDDENALRRRIDVLKAEQLNIAKQMAGQNVRVELAEAALKRASQLLAQGYVAEEMAQQKQADLLDQRNRFQALERDELSTQQELQARLSELASIPLRQRNELAQLERLLASTNQEWAESEGKRHVVVLAPEDGVATAVVAETGQTVDSNRPLMSILPSGATLQAHLYAPSRAVGFIHPGERVTLRYQAYPYQKFGHAMGTVASVSKTALLASDMAGTQSGQSNAEPVYLITIALARQTITAYGNPQPLQAGMLLEADVLQEKRKLYEWVLEPLYSLSGKL